MRRIPLSALLLCFVFFLLPHSAKAQNTQDFTITSFVQNYNLIKNSDGTSTAKIDEYISAYFPVLNQNHGILRALHKSYDGVSLKLSDIAVDNSEFGSTKPGTPLPFTSYNENDNTILKIGNADKFVYGAQNYHISYTMQNVVRNFGDHQELYINVNGTEWNQQFYSVESIIIMENSIANTVQKQVCFTGTLKSTESSCEISKSPETSTQTSFITSTTRTLNASENLSVALWMPQGTFTVKGLSTVQKIINKLIFIGAFAIFLVPIIVLIILFRRWLKHGRDQKKKGIIVAQYEPLKTLDVLNSGVILKQTSTPTAITAQIIELAIGGYLRIIDEGLDGLSFEYTLEKLKDYKDLPDDQQLIMNALFNESDSIKLSKLKNKLSKNAKVIQKIVDTQMVKDGYYLIAPSAQKLNYRTVGMALLVLGMFSLFTGLSLIASGNLLLATSGLSALLSGIIILIFGAIMPSRTVKGSEANDYLLGLKEYIKLAEKDRIIFHQSLQSAERKTIDINNPAQKIHLYESLLPYAILFGLENSWSKEFANLYAEPPNWYNSSSNTFNAIYFSSAMSNFSSTSSSSFSPASSSGGGGFGGGGSGGGGGGGGGGGW